MTGIIDETADHRTIRSEDRSCNPGDVKFSGGVKRLAGDKLASNREMAVERRKIEIFMRAAGEVAVGWTARDDSGMGIDAEAGGQRRCEGEGVTGRTSHAVAGNAEREGLPFGGSLMCDRGRRRAAVTDLQLEALADRYAVGIGGRHLDRMVAKIAVGRHARDDSGMGVDAKTGWQ